MSFTLGQLKIFWAVVHSPSLTQAAKQLGMSQPALSQQLSRLEGLIGGKLFDRQGGQLVLSDAGRYLVDKAETILALSDQTEAGLAEILSGHAGRIAVGCLSSLARGLLPRVQARLANLYPDLEIDVHELAPLEALEQLYGRNLQVALMSSASIAGNRLAFSQVEVLSDPYVLATPADLDLSGIEDPDRQLGDADLATVNRCIAFNFGNQHNRRVEEFYRRILPRHRTITRCRNYDTALAMVEQRVGIALVPQLTAEHWGKRLFDVRLHALPMASRPVVALVASQYRRARPFTGFLDALQVIGRKLPLTPVEPTPPFIAKALAADTP